jgi:anti-sigma factor (TIGR02949 family)
LTVGITPSGRENTVDRPDEYTCEQALRRLDGYLDRELAPEEMDLVRRHLDVCAHCAQDFRYQESVLEEIAAKLRRVHLPDGLADRVFRGLTPPRPDP